MKPEDTQELKELIEFLKENNIGDFELERGDLKVRIKFAQETSGPDLAQMARLMAAQQQAAAPAVLPEVYAAGRPAAGGQCTRAGVPRARRGKTLRCTW